MPQTLDLNHAARQIFSAALAGVDSGAAVKRAIQLDGDHLRIVDTEFDLRVHPLLIYSVAVGKAAHSMAAALDAVLQHRLEGGVVSAPRTRATLSDRWRVFAGGHPLPNGASLEAARASFDLLRGRADHDSALIIFLVSGGGSAMVEWPRDDRITLEELRETNRALVSCGASIAEVNTVRRALSAVKGGGLSASAPHAAQVSLIVSDVCEGNEANVASGPTLAPSSSSSLSVAHDDAAFVIARYDLASRLPAAVIRAIERAASHPIENPVEHMPDDVLRHHYVLLDNRRAIECAVEAARARGFTVEVARDIVEQDVAEASSASVARLIDLSRRHITRAGAVCLISGGEVACPVRGVGVGGRNSETALRCAIELDVHQRASGGGAVPSEMVALCAGTDGIDGNSLAAGAIADGTTLARARAKHLDAQHFLESSDAYTFFDALGDAVVTGPTGTNVRDLRIMLAKTKDEG